MRFILICLLLFSCVSAFCQKQRFSLKLKTDDKTSLHGNSFWLEVKISSKDTSFYYGLHFNQGDKVENIPSGEYTVSISSMFDQKISKSIVLDKNKTLKFKLEKLNKKITAKVFSAGLTDGDTMYVLHNATGRLLSEKIGIVKNGDKFFALAFKGTGDEVFSQQEFDPSALDYVKEFESSLPKYNKITGCTVIETYTVQLNGKYYSVNDGTCQWNGFFKLVKQFFPVQEE